MKLLIIGGVAGGASCAARARRLSEDAEIILFERGPFVSFANCGLPYFVGDLIESEEDLLVATPELFRQRFRIDVRLGHEVLAVDRGKSEIEVREISTGKLYREAYDALVLSPGADPLRPPLPGIDLPGVFTLRTIPDGRQIKEWILEKHVREALIIGGGFIGLEMAENLFRRGIRVTILEAADQILPPFDREMTARMREHLESREMTLLLGDPVSGFEKNSEGRLVVSSKSGKKIETDMALLSIGIRPENRLAKQSGLEIGERGGIRVDEGMQTSDSKIWAVGDVAEKTDFVTKEPAMIPLAGPANRQGRTAADRIFGRPVKFRGAQGTAVCKALETVCAITGAGEKTLRRMNIPYEKAYIHANHHAGYYPGAKSLTLKLLFSPSGGQILGAQATGEEGVEKRIDVIAMALQKKATVYDLEEAELCYAPQFGSAKDPVNIAGMVAANALRGDAPLSQWDRLDWEKDFLLDVRTSGEFEKKHAPKAVHIPLHQLRERVSELPRDRDIHVYCGVGQRAHNAVRLLRLKGFRAFNLSGGIRTYLDSL